MIGVVNRIEQRFDIEDEKCFLYTSLDRGDGYPICSKQLIIDKDMFVACYKEWILGENNGKTNERKIEEN